MKNIFKLLLSLFVLLTFSCSDETKVNQYEDLQIMAKKDPVPAWINLNQDPGKGSMLFDAVTYEPQPEWSLCSSTVVGDELISVYSNMAGETYTLRRNWSGRAYLSFSWNNAGSGNYGGYTMNWVSHWGGTC